jgi:ABC-type phosphate transport system substrate-binding protein
MADAELGDETHSAYVRAMPKARGTVTSYQAAPGAAGVADCSLVRKEIHPCSQLAVRSFASMTVQLRPTQAGAIPPLSVCTSFYAAPPQEAPPTSTPLSVRDTRGSRLSQQRHGGSAARS